MDYQAHIEFGNEHNHFLRHNQIRLVFLEKDHAVTELTIGPDSLNSLGFLHGGVYFTMADSAAGSAARTTGMGYVTQNSSIHFLRGTSSGTIRADARVRHRGRKTCLLAVEITDEKGTLLADASVTMFCVGTFDPEHGFTPFSQT